MLLFGTNLLSGRCDQGAARLICGTLGRNNTLSSRSFLLRFTGAALSVSNSLRCFTSAATLSGQVSPFQKYFISAQYVFVWVLTLIKRAVVRMRSLGLTRTFKWAAVFVPAVVDGIN